MKKHTVYFMLIATMSLLGMTSCDKISDATTVEKTFTMTIPPTDFTYTDSTTVKTDGMKLIYSRKMYFNIEDSLKKYNLTGTMKITGVMPEILTIESGDGTKLYWADLFISNASGNSTSTGKLFGIGEVDPENVTQASFGFDPILIQNPMYSSYRTQMEQEQPSAFETMKTFPYFLQVYAKTSGTVTMPKTVNLKISGKFTIKSNISI